MTRFLDKLRIPTSLGLFIIALSIGTGVYFVSEKKIFTTQATPDSTPQNIIISNIEDTSVTISWDTRAATTSFITYGQNGTNEQTAIDDRDNIKPTARVFHYITLQNLIPATTYKTKIISGGYITPQLIQFSTAPSSTNQNGLKPVIGSVLDNNNESLQEGVVFLETEGIIKQSAVIKELGNFIIPLNVARKEDLTDIFKPQDDTQAKLTIKSPQGQSIVLLSLENLQSPLPPVKIGEALDLTAIKLQPTQGLENELSWFDVNNDGVVNSSDYSTIINNFGKNPKNPKADLNSDGVVDSKDLLLIQDKVIKFIP